MIKSKGIAELESLASTQWGMFTTAQARDIGVGRTQIARMVSSGRTEPVLYGTYRFVAGDVPPKADALAAWMSVYPKETVWERMGKHPFDAVAAGRTAAYLHGIGDFHPEPYTFDLVARKQTSRSDVKYRLRKLDESDVVLVEGIPATSIERTIAELLRDGEDPEQVGRLVVEAVRNGYDLDRSKLVALLEPILNMDAARSSYQGLAAATLVQLDDALLQRAIKDLRNVSAHGLVPEQRRLADDYLNGRLCRFSEEDEREIQNS